MSTVERDRPDALSVAEVLRIMDVATAIRQDREIVEEQLNLDELKARLRERMIAAAKVTGEEITQEEVDAAITQYYDSLYNFHEPEPGLNLYLAHAWVRRNEILTYAGLALGALLLTWFLFLSPRGVFTITGRTRRKVEAVSVQVAGHQAAIFNLVKSRGAPAELTQLMAEADEARKSQDVARLEQVNGSLAALEDRVRRVDGLATEVDRLRNGARAVVKDPLVAQEIDKLAGEAETYKAGSDADRLQGVRDQLATLERQLREEYTVSVISASGNGRSAVKRAFNDTDGKRVSGYYLLVEARRPDGGVVKRKVHNAETGKDEEVSAWGERVPVEVYDRLAKDKKEDGILNESTFAVKKVGFAEEQVTMPGSDGRPLTRATQITTW